MEHLKFPGCLTSNAAFAQGFLLWISQQEGKIIFR